MSICTMVCDLSLHATLTSTTCLPWTPKVTVWARSLQESLQSLPVSLNDHMATSKPHIQTQQESNGSIAQPRQSQTLSRTTNDQ